MPAAIFSSDFGSAGTETVDVGEGAQAWAALKTYPLGRFARRDHALRNVAGSSALVKVVRLGWGDQAPCRGSLGLSVLACQCSAPLSLLRERIPRAHKSLPRACISV